MSYDTFHVRHNTQPDTLAAFFELVSDYPGIDDDTLLAHGLARGSKIGMIIGSTQNLREAVILTLRDFSLLEADTNRLTHEGEYLASLTWNKPTLLPEILHFYFYSWWSPADPSHYCFSWTYAATVQHLWAARETPISLKNLAGSIAAQARETFPDAKVSLSDDSMRGVLNWLRALTPAVINEHERGRVFRRRTFCPPELFVLAVDYVYRWRGVAYGSNLLLEPEVQEQICQACVLEPESFDRVAGYATLQFSFLTQGMGGGWGRYLRLDRTPTLEDVQ